MQGPLRGMVPHLPPEGRPVTARRQERAWCHVVAASRPRLNDRQTMAEAEDIPLFPSSHAAGARTGAEGQVVYATTVDEVQGGLDSEVSSTSCPDQAPRNVHRRISLDRSMWTSRALVGPAGALRRPRPALPSLGDRRPQAGAAPEAQRRPLWSGRQHLPDRFQRGRPRASATRVDSRTAGHVRVPACWLP